MRTVSKIAAGALLVCAVLAGTPVPPAYVSHCTGCGYFGGAAVSPRGDNAIVGGQSAFALVSVSTGAYLWNHTFTDFGSEQEGPFAWSENGAIVAGLAPDTGTTENVWGLDPATGNVKYATSNDGSMSQLTLSATPKSFFTGVVNATYAARVDAKNGRVTWTYLFNDYVQSTATGFSQTAATVRQWIDVAGVGNRVTAFDDVSGKKLWDNKNLGVQATAAAVDSVAAVAFAAGAADPDGNGLSYTTVYAFDLLTGSQIWSINITGCAVQSIATRGGLVFILGTNNTVAFHSKTGDHLWTESMSKLVGSGSVGVTPGRYNGTDVVFASASGTDITALNARTGVTVWTTALPSGHTASLAPLVTDGFVVVPTSTDATAHGYVVGYTLPK